MKHTRKLITVLLTVCLLAILLPAPVSAAAASQIKVENQTLADTGYYAKVGGTWTLQTEAPASGGYLHWDAAEGTLTLYNGVDLSYYTNNGTCIYAEGDLTVAGKGGDIVGGDAIYCTGKVTISADLNSIKVHEVFGNYYGIYGGQGVHITSGASIGLIKGSPGGEVGCAINAANGNVVIDGKVTKMEGWQWVVRASRGSVYLNGSTTIACSNATAIATTTVVLGPYARVIIQSLDRLESADAVSSNENKPVPASGYTDFYWRAGVDAEDAGLFTSSQDAQMPAGARYYEIRPAALNLTAPEFEAAAVGYLQPAAKPITLQNVSKADVLISKMELSGTDAAKFVLNKTDGCTISSSSTDNTTYTLQPIAGLPIGEYEVTVTVTYEHNDIDYMQDTDTTSFTVVAASAHTHTPGDWVDYNDDQHRKVRCTDTACDLNVQYDYEDHDFSDWETTKEPTTTEKGEKERVCQTCRHIDTDFIDMLQESPSKPDDPIDPEKPKTGDESNISLWGTLFFLSAGILVAMTVYGKKKFLNI